MKTRALRRLFQIDQNWVWSISRRRKKFWQKKEKLFLQPDHNRWEMNPARTKDLSQQDFKNKQLCLDLMLYKETQQCLDMRNWFAFQNAITFNEVNKGLLEKCKHYVSNFHEFAKAQSDNLTEIHIQWADIMAHFTETKSNKESKQIMVREQIQDEYKLEGAAGDE